MSWRDRVPMLALFGQAVLQVVWYGLLRPPLPLSPLLAVALALLPLSTLLPAALHSRRRVLLVGGIVSLLYFSHGVMELWSNPAVRALASCEILFALTAIFGLRKTPRAG
jgi:uncharacterized membrane protein